MKYRKFFVFTLLMAVLSGLTALAAPILLQIWDRERSGLSLGKVAVIVAVIVFSKSLSVLLTVYRERFAKDFNKRNFLSLLDGAFHMKYDSLIESGPTNLLERIDLAVNSIYSYMTGDLIQIWARLIVSALCLLLIARIHPLPAALMLLAVPVNYFGYRMLNDRLADLSRRMQKETGEGFQEILSRTQHVDYFKQLPRYDRLLEGIAPSAEKIYGSMARVNEFAQSVSIALKGATEVIQSLVMLLLIYAFSQAHISPFSLMMATLLMPLYFSSISTIVNANINKRDFNTAIELQKEILAQREPDGQETIPEIHRIECEVDGLKLGDRTLDFEARGTLKKGDIAQACGASGSGKSTFAKSLVKFRPIDGVSCNGRRLEDISNDCLRGKIEYVSQNIPIVCGTLRENLLLNTAPGAISDRELADSPILETILKSKTLDTEILEGGANLSGGEKQKIALARALLSKPDVLILDEVCSNIDAQTSGEIYAYLDSTRDQRITLLITHDELPENLVNRRLNQSA